MRTVLAGVLCCWGVVAVAEQDKKGEEPTFNTTVTVKREKATKEGLNPYVREDVKAFKREVKGVTYWNCFGRTLNGVPGGVRKGDVVIEKDGRVWPIEEAKDFNGTYEFKCGKPIEPKKP